MSEQADPSGRDNRRAVPRHRVRLDGELRLRGGQGRACTVYDLGLNGVAVALPGEVRGAPPARGARLSIRVPVGPAGRAARVNGDVRWVAGDTGGHRFGLFFERCNQAAFEMLLDAGADVGARLGARAGTPVGASLSETFPALGGSYLRWLFERGQEILLEDAENADDDTVCALLAHAAIELWSARGRLANTTLEQVRAHLIEHPAVTAGQAPSLPVAVMDAALDGACRRHFATPSHVQPASSALRRGVRESLTASQTPVPRPPNPNEIVLGGRDFDPASRPGAARERPPTERG